MNPLLLGAGALGAGLVGANMLGSQDAQDAFSSVQAEKEGRMGLMEMTLSRYANKKETNPEQMVKELRQHPARYTDEEITMMVNAIMNFREKKSMV